MELSRWSVGSFTCPLSHGPWDTPARAQQADSGWRSTIAPPIGVTVVRPAPYWDDNVVPRYGYHVEDDRVDPCGGPVVPVIRVGPQEQTVPFWLANSLGLARIHGQNGRAGAVAANGCFPRVRMGFL